LVDGVSAHPGLEYPTATTWKLSIHVDGASQTIQLVGRDNGGATTTPRYVELTNIAYDLSNKALWNVFDEHGLLLDLKRLPGESNKRYAERLKDVNRNRGGSSFLGVANSSTRELGLTKISDALSISIYKNQFEQNIHQQLQISFDSVSVSIRSPSMIYKERVYVDPVFRTVDLTKTIHEIPISVVSKDNEEVPLIFVTLDKDEDRPSIQRIKIDYESVLGNYVDVTYAYHETIRYKTYSDLGQLVQKLNSLTGNAGKRLLDASLSMKLSGNESCLGLFIISDIISVDSVMEVPWTPVVLRRISDKEFREYFISSNNTYHDTKFQEYANELRRNSRTLWGSVEADRDFWDAASVDQSFDYIPTLFDPELTKFTTNTGDNVEQNIDAIMAWGRSYLGYRQEVMANLGINYKIFQPGVAHRNDLEPSVFFLQLREGEQEDSNDLISNSMNTNNTVILFSGQR
jgi:hypothetical protein